MRIISGSLKGKKIYEPKDKKTRPLKDLVKESIFNIIKHSNKFDTKIENSIVLDLFSGVGSFGLEAISRGCFKVFFVENYPEALSILKKNINNLKVNDKTSIVERNIYSNLSLESFATKFDIIFLDPPFKDEGLSIIIDKIFNSKVLKDNGILILHRNFKSNDALSKNFNVLEKKKYGLSKIIFGNFN
jgi:16S rRNA (guanine966-N2)-methyltransferase